MTNPWKNVSADEAYAEAQRRIAAVRADGATQLVLGDLPLMELPPEINSLTKLKTLALGRTSLSVQEESVLYKIVSGYPGFRGTKLPRLECLSDLTSLDLGGCEFLSHIGAISELGNLTFLNLGGCARIDDFNHLASLKSLTHLDLSYCFNILNLGPISRLTSLRHLNLSKCLQLNDLDPISQLLDITHLDISSCYQINNIRSLSELKHLKSLKASGCTLIADFSPIASQSALEVLQLSRIRELIPQSQHPSNPQSFSTPLSGAQPLPDISVMSRLTTLTSLDLSGWDHITDLRPLSTLTAITSLKLVQCTQVRNLAPLAALSAITRLDLSSCNQVQNLAPLSQLKSMVELRLFLCRKIVDLRPLSELNSLKSLRLGVCRIEDLQPLSRLTSLTFLDIVMCNRLTDLRPLSTLTHLESLNLNRCPSIRNIEPLSKLVNLRDLNLTACEGVVDLTPLLSLPCLRRLELASVGNQTFGPLRPLLGDLEHLSLHKSQFTDLDESLLGSSQNENVIDKVRSHFADLEQGVAEETEVKVFVLGNGRIGKTQLVRRLMGDEYDESISSTHGIQCRHRTEGQLAEWKTVRVNFWDFGGQDIYHGSHALFLHGQAIFVLLWTPDKESGEYVEGGMTMRNRPLAYWLDYVRTLAGTDCSVLVVQSQCDERSCERLAPMPTEHDFEYLRDVKFSAKEDRGLEELKGLLREAASKVLMKCKGWTIGIGRADVRKQLRDWLEKDQQKPAENRRHRVLKQTDYEKLCESVNKKRTGSVSSPEALLDYLHQTGVVFYKPGLFGGRIILDQEWALGAIYTLFHRGDVLPHLVTSKGRFTRRLLDSLIWGRKVDGNGPYTEQEQELFLDMMQECGNCFRANPKHDEQHRSQEGIYIAPELLPDWGTIRESEYHWTDNVPCDASATLRYRFLHEGVFRGLISKIGRQAGEGAHYGKQGCGFFDRKTHSPVLIEAVPLETLEHPGAGELRLRSWGPGGRSLIETILKSVPSVAVVPPEIERSWGAEPRRELLEIEEISGGEGALTPGPSAARRGEKETGLEKIDARKQRVYLSYAWGEEGDDREKVASQIITKLDEWGYEAVFDKRAMRAGDRISEFMKEIARGHKIVVIISGKYVRSRYCMNELESIFQRELRDDQEFLKRVIPVVLMDAKIHSIADRVVHTKHWKSEFDKLNPDKEHLSPGDLLWLDKFEEFGKHIGQILHLISDQLSPQNIAELTELDFERIRQMLGPAS